MRSLRIAIILFGVFAASIPAATVNISSQPTQLLQTGDSLVCLFADTSYARLASSMGLSPDPSQIFFNFSSAPVAQTGQFTVEVESVNGSAADISRAPVDWSVSGLIETSQYSGPGSVLQDTLTLSSALSQEIFAGSEVQLILTYTGPDVTVGVPGYSLQNDLAVSLAGGPISIGALDYGVTLEYGVTPVYGLVQQDEINPASTAPEPESAALIFAVGMLLCAISLVMKRFRRSVEIGATDSCDYLHATTFMRQRSCDDVCNRIEVSDTIDLDASESFL